MERNPVPYHFKIKGMSCVNCEMRIENALADLEGMVKVKASFSDSLVQVTYDPNILDLDRIIGILNGLDYHVTGKSTGESRSGDNKVTINQLLGIGIIVFAVYIIVKNTVGFDFIPQINQSMSYGILFVTGLITSLHCVAMRSCRQCCRGKRKYSNSNY